jgi:MFS superfamily sulfate permease-like transporter
LNSSIRRFPLFRSLEGWRAGDLPRDFIAGLTLAAIAIPEQMATARLGGFPPLLGFTAFIAGTAAVLLVTALVFFGSGAIASVLTEGLAGVLLFVATRLMQVARLAEIFRRAPAEFLLAIATAGAIVILPIQFGVAAGIAVSLLHGIWSTTRARVIEFERLPGTSIWWPPSGAGEKLDGVMVIAFQAPLSFPNAHDFRHDVLECIRRGRGSLKLIVLEASSIVEIDFTAGEALKGAVRAARDNGIVFAIARLESLRAQETMRRLGIIDALEPGRLFRSVQEAVDALAMEGSIASSVA